MKSYLVAAAVLFLAAAVGSACSKKEEEEEKKTAPEEAKAEARAKIPGHLPGHERAKALLKRAGREIDHVKLVLKPETMEATGASDFHPFSSKGNSILLFVFEFADAETAEAAAANLAPALAELETIYNTRTTVNGKLVLLAGTQEKAPAKDPDGLLKAFREAFAN